MRRDEYLEDLDWLWMSQREHLADPISVWKVIRSLLGWTWNFFLRTT